jgi:Dihydrodipicolinate reductase
MPDCQSACFMNQFPVYDVSMTETHHIHKLDAPSGTAITLADTIVEELDRKNHWTKEKASAPDEFPIHSIREGEVPGIHTICYDSDADSITITMMPKIVADLLWVLYWLPNIRLLIKVCLL